MAPSPIAAHAPGELNLVALEKFLERELPEGMTGQLRARLLAGGRSNPTYELGDGTRSWILRRPPYGEYLPSAHDMGREARVMTALATTSVPVPRVVARCDETDVLGAPFYVMDKLTGRTFRTHTDTAELTPAQAAAMSGLMIDTLLALHDVEPAAVGLADLGRAEGYLERQLNRWERNWHTVKTTERDHVDALVAALKETMPPLRYPGIVHGDYRLDNVMFDLDAAPKVVGVLDWEMSTLGDTLADLGLLVSFWDEEGQPFNALSLGATAHAGFPPAEEIASRYAELRGVDVGDLEWYIAFADFKIAVILEQIHHRHLRGTTVGAGFEDIGPMVDPLLDRAHDRMGQVTRSGRGSRS